MGIFGRLWITGALTVIAALAALVSRETLYADHSFGESARPDSYWAGLPPPAPGESITVSVSGLDDAATKAAIRRWNAAVWWPLFTLVSGAGADIVVRPGAATYTRPGVAHCEVAVKTNRAVFLTHELGHCLGLADHTAPACEDEVYRGIMSYCWLTSRIAAADLAALGRLGFRVMVKAP